MADRLTGRPSSAGLPSPERGLCSPPRRPRFFSVLRRRRPLWSALLVLVLFAHLGLVAHLVDTVADWNADASLPPRLQVAYVRELIPTAAVSRPRAEPAPPAPPAPAARAPQRPERAAAPAPAASEPAVVDAVGAAAEQPEALADTDTATAVAEPGPTASVADAASAPPAPGSAALSVAASPVEELPDAILAAPAFNWPASTRLSYRLTGQYRGEVHGSAQVEWVLAWPRYQVNLDVTVGLLIAPLFSRRMRSDGLLGPAGLQPERYEEDSKMAFRDRRRISLRLDDHGVLLANGQRWTRPPVAAVPVDSAVPTSAVQDSASQFVQLSYLFSVQPQRLVPGETIAFPLALPRRVEPWVYEVVEAQTLYTPFGPLETFHVRPRRGTPRRGDLLAEAWFSPQLAYLPVRIRIEQDADTFVDLMIERRPELAAR